MKLIAPYTKSYAEIDEILSGGSKFEHFHANGFKIEFQYDQVVYITFDDLPNVTLFGGKEEYKLFDKLFCIPPINLKAVLTELVWKLLFENMTKELLYEMINNATNDGMQRGVKSAQMKILEALGLTSSK